MPASTEVQISQQDWLEIVREKVNAIRFGSVQISVHEGRVTQVEAIEKTRISGASSHAGPGARPAFVPKKA